MELIYSGQEVKRLLKENIPGYKPVIGGNASAENEKINKKANKDSINNTKLSKPKEDSKPVIGVGKQSTDIGNNKNMLDIQFDQDPGKEFKDRVKKQVTGEDSEFGNKPDGHATNNVNKAFYDAAKKASSEFSNARNKLSNSGLTGKNLPVDKKNTPFNEDANKKIKKLSFKNTQFINEAHMLSLIPDDYKKNDNKFIMRDRVNEEYLIEWKINETTNTSNPTISKQQSKQKIQEEFDKIKSLYEYKSREQMGTLTNQGRVAENNKVSNSIKIIRDLSDN